MHCKKNYARLLLLGCACVTLSAFASSATPGKVIAGYVEKVTLMPMRITLSAKLDTGALTSSIHAQSIERFKKGDEKWVRFTLNVKDSKDESHTVQLERPLVRRVKIKEDEDRHDSRLVVMLRLCFDGRPTKAQFTLNDRSNYLYPVLLGRRFLEGRAVVDPELSFQTQRACDLPVNTDS